MSIGSLLKFRIQEGTVPRCTPIPRPMLSTPLVSVCRHTGAVRQLSCNRRPTAHSHSRWPMNEVFLRGHTPHAAAAPGQLACEVTWSAAPSVTAAGRQVMNLLRRRRHHRRRRCHRWPTGRGQPTTVTGSVSLTESCECPELLQLRGSHRSSSHSVPNRNCKQTERKSCGGPFVHGWSST